MRARAGDRPFYTPTGYGTDLAKGKETRVIDGKGQVLEYPLHGDVALRESERRRPLGQPRLRKSARKLRADHGERGEVTVAQVYETVELGKLDPEVIVTPGIFVTRVVKVPRKVGAYRAPAGGSVNTGDFRQGRGMSYTKLTRTRSRSASHRTFPRART